MPIVNYRVHEVSSYINWIYFFHAWGFQPRFAAIADIHGCDSCRAVWLTTFPEEERVKAAEAMQLFKEANRVLNQLDEDITIQCIYRLCRANANGDNLVIEDTVFPLLRQQTSHPDGSPFLCLSDFVRPLSSGIADTVGLFASSISEGAEGYYKDDPYKHLLVQTLTDRLAEAATEKMHKYVRKVAWGYAPDESLSIPDLLVEKYQDIRPAVGYPSLPDQSVNFILDELLDMKQIGITLTENGAMHPHASVCGIMLAHPQARYFAVGKIGEDQLEDYARRRGKPVQEMRKFLAANLR
ncbi:MAG: 5-methyltetrahydrofolate--homocysteine methyltransferase [Bacteroides sp.]|nr:5-methyltetrahydrofolate--homocysteine methyltransferase [Bacteroides sp.]